MRHSFLELNLETNLHMSNWIYLLRWWRQYVASSRVCGNVGLACKTRSKRDRGIQKNGVGFDVYHIVIWTFCQNLKNGDSINQWINLLAVINKSRRHMIHPWTRGADDTALEARVISNDFMFGSPASTRTFVSRWFSDLLIIWFLKHVKTLMLSLSMLHFSSHTAVTEVRMTHVWKLEWFHMISCSEPQNQGDSLIHLLMLIDQSILDMCIWMHLVSHLVLQVCILHLQVWLIMENLENADFISYVKIVHDFTPKIFTPK